MSETKPRETKKGRWWIWILWWKIDPEELDKQVSQYETLILVRAARGGAVFCLLFSIVVTLVFEFYGTLDVTAYIDVGLMSGLAVSIYFGHRWAMIAAMILWTFEKIFLVVLPMSQYAPSNNIAIQVIWWCLYMHAFYFVYRVEQEKRQRASIAFA